MIVIGQRPIKKGVTPILACSFISTGVGRLEMELGRRTYGLFPCCWLDDGLSEEESREAVGDEVVRDSWVALEIDAVETRFFEEDEATNQCECE